MLDNSSKLIKILSANNLIIVHSHLKLMGKCKISPWSLTHVPSSPRREGEKDSSKLVFRVGLNLLIFNLPSELPKKRRPNELITCKWAPGIQAIRSYRPRREKKFVSWVLNLIHLIDGCIFRYEIRNRLKWTFKFTIYLNEASPKATNRAIFYTLRAKREDCTAGTAVDITHVQYTVEIIETKGILNDPGSTRTNELRQGEIMATSRTDPRFKIIRSQSQNYKV